MKKNILIMCLLMLFAASAVNAGQNINIIPRPNFVEEKQGNFNVSGCSVNYDAATVGASELTVINEFAGRLSLVTGKTIKLRDKIKNKGINFRVNASMQAESYEIEVTPKKINVVAADYNGILYSVQTLAQLLPVNYFENKENKEVKWTIPCVLIKDCPRFAYRGVMIDVARHFYTIDEMKKIVDVMALHKLNRLHWHLTDDQGWRIEIKKYPKLTEIGAFRDHTMIGHYDNKPHVFDGVRHGGFYTQEEIKDFVKYAANKGITIVPEIDLPGHMVAALASYPEIGCTGGPYKVREIWAIATEVLCPGKEKTFEFIEGVLSEVMELFPSEYIHIGGDECPKTEWEKCPDCQKRIAELGLKSDGKHTKEQFLQNYVTARVQEFLNKHGRKLIGWDEILEGNLAKGATVMSWRGVTGGIQAAKMGFDVVMSPTTYCYIDYYQVKDRTSEPLGIGGFLPLEQVYSYEPLKDIPQEAWKHILGVQVNLWTEYIVRPEHLEYMLLPRMCALSEVGWCEPENKDIERFKTSLTEHTFKIFDILNYTYCKAIKGEYGLKGVEPGQN